MSARLRLLALLALVAPLGVGAKLYAGPGAPWVTAYGAGILYEIFWVLAVLLLRPALPVPRVAIGVFAVTGALEFLQLWRTPALQAIRGSFIGHALIGSTFAWWDFPHYAAGCLLAVPIARAALRSW